MTLMALHVIIPLALILAALALVFLKDLYHMVVVFAVFSFLLAVEFYILQAPDVAIAEAGIGAGLTTAILIIAIRATNPSGRRGS